MSTLKPKGQFCVDRKSLFSHLDSSINSINLPLNPARKLIGVETQSQFGFTF